MKCFQRTEMDSKKEKKRKKEKERKEKEGKKEIYTESLVPCRLSRIVFNNAQRIRRKGKRKGKEERKEVHGLPPPSFPMTLCTILKKYVRVDWGRVSYCTYMYKRFGRLAKARSLMILIKLFCNILT